MAFWPSPFFHEGFPMKLGNFFIFKALLILLIPAANAYVEYPYNGGEYVELFHELEIGQPTRPSGIPFTAAVMKYGKAVVKEGQFHVSADKMPWSSYWYPTHDRQIFEDSDEGAESTLRRYDRYAERIKPNSQSSRDFEEENGYDPQSGGWAGLCHAWALASIMEDEPTKAVYKNGIKFRVQDLKALLIKTYENSFPKVFYGQRNNADWQSIYEDIYPEQFHTILMAELFEKKQAFIMDYEAGFQIWNVPVYRAKVKIEKDPDNPSVVHVSTTLTTASPRVESTFVGTSPLPFTYKYDLYGNWEAPDRFVVDYGIWVKRGYTDSRRSHPDFIVVKPDKVDRKSANEFIDVEIVDKILKGSR